MTKLGKTNIKTMNIKFIEWLKTSNRWKHLLGGTLVGLGANDLYCACYAGIGIGAALEFKDATWGGQWDWIDLALTVGGTGLGYLTRFVICNLL